MGKEAGIVVEAGRPWAVPPLQLGFVVPGIDGARPAVDEQPDDRLRPRAMVPRMRSERIGAERRRLAEQSLLVQKAGQRQHAEAAAGAAQEIATRGIGRRWPSKQLVAALHGKLGVTLSELHAGP